jgi:pimeloyl-ACP methyl ester carboxylesterase
MSPFHYTDRAYTLAMSALIARLDVDRVDWVGTSLGGHIGMMLAAEPSSPIRRLVLNDIGGRVSVHALHRIGHYLRREWRFNSMHEAEEHLRDIHAPFGDLTDDQWRHLTETSVVPDGRGRLRFHYDPAIGGRFGIPLWADVILWHLWDKIQCPVLVIRGAESDLLSEATLKSMLTRGPAAKAGKVHAVTIDGCGHAPALMSEDQIATIGRFFSSPATDAGEGEDYAASGM